MRPWWQPVTLMKSVRIAIRAASSAGRDSGTNSYSPQRAFAALWPHACAEHYGAYPFRNGPGGSPPVGVLSTACVQSGVLLPTGAFAVTAGTDTDNLLSFCAIIGFNATGAGQDSVFATAFLQVEGVPECTLNGWPNEITVTNYTKVSLPLERCPGNLTNVVPIELQQAFYNTTVRA
jgi:hypothetical protein